MKKLFFFRLMIVVLILSKLPFSFSEDENHTPCPEGEQWCACSKDMGVYDLKDQTVLEVNPPSDEWTKFQLESSPDFKTYTIVQSMEGVYSDRIVDLKKMTDQKNVFFMKKNLQEISSSQSYDVIIVNNYNVQFDEREDFFKNLNAILNENGTIYLTTIRRDFFYDHSDAIFLPRIIEKYFKDTHISLEQTQDALDIYGLVIITSKPGLSVEKHKTSSLLTSTKRPRHKNRSPLY